MNRLEYLKNFLNIFSYINGESCDKLAGSLAKLLDQDPKETNVLIYGNGRSAEYEFLKSLDLPAGSKVLVQAFTCNAAINPILWLGLEPVYVDINPWTFNMSVDDLEKKINSDTRVIIVQHTFGYPAEIERIVEIARRNNIVVLEDCAHIIGGEHSGKKLGTFGDGAIFSFGLEKMLSSRVGGALLVNNKSILEKVSSQFNEVPNMKFKEVLIWFLHPLIWWILRRFGAKKMDLAKVLKNLGLLNMGFFDGELMGKYPKSKYPVTLANVLAKFVISELEQLDKNIQNRINLTRVYVESLRPVEQIGIYGKPVQLKDSDLSFSSTVESVSVEDVACVRFPIVCNSVKLRESLYDRLTGLGYYIGEWYRPVVFPEGTDLELMKYRPGSCPVAEVISAHVLNLPTAMHITEDDVKKISREIINSIS